MDIPVDDENPLQSVNLPRVMRRNRDVSEEAETHGTIGDSVVAWRADRTKAPWSLARNRKVDPGESAAGGSSRGVPRARAYDRVRIEPPSATLASLAHTLDVIVRVREVELLERRVPPLNMIHH